MKVNSPACATQDGIKVVVSIKTCIAVERLCSGRILVCRLMGDGINYRVEKNIPDEGAKYAEAVIARSEAIECATTPGEVRMRGNRT